MAIHAIVLEKPLGEQAEGSVIQCDEETAGALITAGVAREATEEDLAPKEEEGQEEEPKEEGDEDEGAETMTEAVHRLATNAEHTVQKAVDSVAEKLAKKNGKLHIPTNRHIAGSDEYETGGFKDLGEACKTWLRSAKYGDFDASKRMSKWSKLAAARTKATGMSISGSHQGSDLVPQKWAEDLWRLSFQSVPDLLGMMTKYNMQGVQTLNIPSWVQTSATSAVQANVTSEAGTITATVGATATQQLTLQKGAVLVNVSDELMRFNQYNLTTVLEQIVPERIRYLVNDGIVNGGNSQINLINNAATITIIAQQANTFNYNDIINMESALFDEFGSQEGTCWLTNKANLAQLYTLAFPSKSATYQFPAYVPGTFNDMLATKIRGTLLGRPVYFLENVPAAGTRGALILANLKSLAAGYEGMYSDYTPYLYFNLAQDSFRFLFYYDTANPLTAPYTRKDGSATSNIIVLSAGSTSSS